MSWERSVGALVALAKADSRYIGSHSRILIAMRITLSEKYLRYGERLAEHFFKASRGEWLCKRFGKTRSSVGEY